MTIVDVPVSRWIPDWLIRQKMRGLVPQYQQLDGLRYKLFTLSRQHTFGGIYLWDSRGQAQRWFSPDWFARVRRERGVEGRVRWFDAPVVIDNTPGGTPADLHASTVSTLAMLPVQVGESRDRLVARFVAQAAAERHTPGLLRKVFVIDADGRPGSASLWSDQASAERYLDRASRRRPAHGPSPDAVSPTIERPPVEWFDTPIITPGLAAHPSASPAAR